MKKSIKGIVLGVLVVLLLCGCEKTIPKLSNGDEAMVTFSDGSMISVNEVYEKLKPNATNIVINMIDSKIFESEYPDDLEDAKKYAESYMNSIKTYYTDENGNYDESALLNALRQYYGYSSLDEYKESLRITYLRNKVIENYAKTLIKENEINKYYENEIVGDREVSHIQIIPDVKDDMTNDEKEEAENAALETAKEVIAKLKKGDKFEDLVKEYSEDDATKDSQGSLGYINKGTYGSEEFDQEVYRLAVGEYSNTPIKTTKGYEIVYVTNEKEKKKLDEVKDTIIEALANEKIDEDATIQVDAVKEIRKKYGVEIIDDEVKQEYSKYMNRLYDSASQANTQN